MAGKLTVDAAQCDCRDRLRHWFSQPLGQYLLELEEARISRILPNLFGYHILQIGSPGKRDMLAGSCIAHKILMIFGSGDHASGEISLLGDEGSLAIASDSMDVVVLPHVLEFVANPHKLLREVERILIGEGHLVLTGFNPWSLWGLWRLLLIWREDPPWRGHFYGSTRIKDWLSLLDFELLQNESFFFRPPLQSMSLMQSLSFWEKLGKYCWPFFGGAYVIVAKKRIVPLTPMKMRWRARRQLVTSGIIEPTARLQNDER